MKHGNGGAAETSELETGIKRDAQDETPLDRKICEPMALRSANAGRDRVTCEACVFMRSRAIYYSP